ncbi:myosin heavy chain, clone, putative [Entamoeba histolytica HM-3:IMSS]|uniref:Myosin heavy chain, clone, putative n=1 Tax=Entamoeba histolytica HM-3:IMSS TaxID=885315 RepID=M7W706_ENTHI|nr:myosin heavy chain, clone, putative [Entamoeba histolytica HM-3:IMSS]
MTEQQRSRFSVKKQEAVRKHREETVDSVIDTYAQLIENIDQKNEENKIKQPNKKEDNEKNEKKKLSVDPKRIDSIFDKLEEVNGHNNEANIEDKLTSQDLATNIAMSYVQNEYDIDINNPQNELTKSKIEPNTFKSSLKRFSYCPVLFSNNDENIKEIKEEFNVGVDNILDSYIEINTNQPQQEEKENQQNPTLTAPPIPSQDFDKKETLYNKVEIPYLLEDNKTSKTKSFEEMINHYPIELPNEPKSLIHNDNKSDNEEEKLIPNSSLIKTKETKEELFNTSDSINNIKLNTNENQENKMVDVIVNWHRKKPNKEFQEEWEQEKYNLKSYNLEDTISDKTVDENELSKLELKRFNTQPIDVSSIISPKKSNGIINNTQEMIEDELDKKHIEKLTEETKRLTKSANENEEDFTKYLIQYQGKPSTFQGRKGNEGISEVKEEFKVGIDNILDSYIDLNNNTTQQEEKLEELNHLDLQKSCLDKEENEKIISQEEEKEKEEKENGIDKTRKENGDDLQNSSVIDLHLLGNGTPLFIKVNLNVNLKENIEEQEKKRTLLQLTTNQMKKAVVEKLKKESIKKLENSGLDNEEINKKVNLCVQVAEKEWDDAVVRLGQKTAIFSPVKKN